MPRQSLFKTQRAASAATAVVMLVVLVASLGLTYKFIERRGVVLTSMQIGDLIMDVPRQWLRVDQSPGADARILAEFVDPSPANRSLTIFSRAFDQPELHKAMVLYVLTTMVDASRHGQVILRSDPYDLNLDNEQFAGAFVSAVSADADTIHKAVALFVLAELADASRHGQVILRSDSYDLNLDNEQFAGAFVSAVSADADTVHGVLAFTQRDNGQRYWLVYVVGPADEDTMSKLVLEDRLLKRVAGSARIAGHERPG